jgi:hypothetical protein
LGGFGVIWDIKGLWFIAFRAQGSGLRQKEKKKASLFLGQKGLPNCLVLKVRGARGVGAVPFLLKKNNSGYGLRVTRYGFKLI